MESTHIDASRFLRGGIYNTEEEAIFGALQTPIKKIPTEEKSGAEKTATDKFVKSFFPGIQKPL